MQDVFCTSRPTVSRCSTFERRSNNSEKRLRNQGPKLSPPSCSVDMVAAVALSPHFRPEPPFGE